jgi:hypothetical protein
MLTRCAKVPGGYKLKRQQDVDFQQPDCRRVCGLGQEVSESRHGGPDSRLCAGKGHEGLSAPRSTARWACVQHHRRDRHGRCVLPEENAFPEVQGLKGPFTCLNSARYGIAWGALGAAEDCWFRARQYTLDRKQFGRPLAANQLIQKETGRHADRNCAGPAGLPAPGPHEGRGHGRGGDHLHPEAQLLRQGAGHCPHGARHDGRQRHQRRVRRGPPPGEPGSGQHLRRHARHSCADPGPGADRVDLQAFAWPCWRIRRLAF